MKIDAGRVIERRRAQRRALLARAEALCAALDPAWVVDAVVVFGSVARGDFNVWSDVDVLVIAPTVDAGMTDRLRTLGADVGLVRPIAWTPEELDRQLAKNNPVAVESVERGIWLVGAPAANPQG